MSVVKRLINELLARTGYVIKESKKLPCYHMFGLRGMPIRTILDIGANEGQFAASMRPVFPEAHIISFEPIDDVFQALSQHASQDPLWNVENVAIGEFDARQQMNVHLDHSPSSSFLKATQRETQLFPKTERQKIIDVDVRRLDSWAKETEFCLKADILVKMDVQGFELAVIRGGKSTIAQADAIFIETSVQQLYERQSSFVEITSELDQLGFSFQGVVDYGLDSNSRVISFDSIFLH